jgi:hypothetical protein
MGKDLGTYHVRVELVGGDGWIQEWDTGARYINGSGNCHPLDAMRIQPGWDDEHDLLRTIRWMFTEGNYGCDCNRKLFLDRAHQQEGDESWEYPCGDTMMIERITVIRPDGSEVEV